jgi:hypothetical protein
LKHAVLFILAALCASCVTNDFRVVEALKPGMTQVEASDVITSFGFERRTVMNRPLDGWATTDGTFENIHGRASAIEEELRQEVRVAEMYPVGHGLLGFGLLYLFYGPDGRLLEHYRYQIN